MSDIGHFLSVDSCVTNIRSEGEGCFTICRNNSVGRIIFPGMAVKVVLLAGITVKVLL